MKKQVQIIFSILLFLFVMRSPLFAQFEQYNHPELKWETIETPHFFVHFHNGEKRTPMLVAQLAEEIYGPVTKAYNFEPDEKIHFIIKDYDDYSNGAAFYYDNKIEIWATPLDFILRGTNDWLKNVVTHEFAHMIQLQTARKLPRRIPSFSLQVLDYESEKRPDVLYGFPKRVISYQVAGTAMPGWFAEGVAQYETMKLGNDRWDSHRDMILRMRSLNNDLFSLTEMGVFGKTSIGNESVYNQGFSFVTFLAEKYGDKVLENISRAMASPLRVNIDSAIKKATGTSGKELYQEWKSGLDTKYVGEAEKINKNLVEGKLLDTRGEANIYPVWLADGNSIVYLSNNRSDYLSSTSLFKHDLVTGKRKALVSGVNSSPAYNEATEQLVYSKITKNKNHSHFFDLYLYDLKTKKEKKITESRRATYPTFSPDGKTAYFVSGADGMSNLYSVDIATGDTKLLKDFPNGESLFSSSVSPDGRSLLIAIGKDFGRDIAKINSDGTGFTYLLEGREDERDPVYTPDGRKFYYSSDRTGVFNLYEYDLATGMSKGITNVLGGAFMPSYHNEQIMYSLYTAAGYKIGHIDNITYTGIENNVKVTNAGNGSNGNNSDKNGGSEQIPEYEVKPYKYQSMMTFVLPRLMLDYGKPKVGIYSYAGDPLDKYTIFVGAAVNKDFDRDLFALLDYKKYKRTIFLELYNVTRHTAFFEEPFNHFDVTLGFWEADLGLRQKLSETQEAQAKIVYGRQWSNLDLQRPNVVDRPLRYDYFIGWNFNLNWKYNALLRRNDSEINPSNGRSIEIDYWRNSDEIFEDFEIKNGRLDEVYKNYQYNKIVFDWKEYIGTPFLLEKSAVTLELAGGFIDRSVDDFLNFFAGGLTGIKGYSFYSLEGRKKLNGTFTYRFPVRKSMGFQVGPWYFDKLYASASYQIANAWNEGFDDNFKDGIDLGVRMDMVSFYVFPTKVGFNAAYGFDEFIIPSRPVGNQLEGKSWKFFLTVLFGFGF